MNVAAVSSVASMIEPVCQILCALKEHGDSSAGLAEAALKVCIEKDQKLRTGNWEAWPLNAAQQQYAALDAYASLLLYQVSVGIFPWQGWRLLSLSAVASLELAPEMLASVLRSRSRPASEGWCPVNTQR